MSKKAEIEFLKLQLKELQDFHAIFSELGPDDFVCIEEASKYQPLDDKTLAKMSDDERKEYIEDMEFVRASKERQARFHTNHEQVARLADEYCFDGTIFRGLSGQEFDYFCVLRRIDKQIELIPRIIAKIEKPIDNSIIPEGAEMLSVPQVARLLGWGEINSIVNGEKHHGLTGYERSLVYKIAFYTGLRWNEIATLQRRDFDLTSPLPTITVQAKNAKNKKTESVPLRTDLAAELAAYFKQNLAMPTAKAFSGIWQGESGAMIGEDLTLAKIERKTYDGHADFHALRHTYGTNLAKAGVPPQKCQKLMRHSSIDLTMKYYTHLSVADTSEAVNNLPNVKAKKIKTGTMDIPENLTTNLTENPRKTQQNAVKSNKTIVPQKTCNKNITSCGTISNQKAGDRIRTDDVQLGKLAFYH